MSIGSSTAKSGYSTEEFFAELINRNIEFKCAIKDFLDVSEDIDLSAKVLKGVQKGDVELTLSDNTKIQASIKKSTADFSQLDRRWLSSLSSAINVPSDITDKIQAGLDSIRLKKGTHQQLILPEYKDDIVNYFKNNINTFMDEMFTRQNANVSLFVVFNADIATWYLLHMSDVLKYASEQTVSVSNKGVLKFGDCISLQRKGGDGNYKKVPKTDSSHPSNQIQTKIKPLKIVKSLHPMIIQPIK